MAWYDKFTPSGRKAIQLEKLEKELAARSSKPKQARLKSSKSSRPSEKDLLLVKLSSRKVHHSVIPLEREIIGWQNTFDYIIELGIERKGELGEYAFPREERSLEVMVRDLQQFIARVIAFNEQVKKIIALGKLLERGITILGRPSSKPERWLLKDCLSISNKLNSLLEKLDDFESFPFLSIEPDDDSSSNLAEAQVLAVKISDVINEILSLQQLFQDLDDLSDRVERDVEVVLSSG